MTTLTKYVVALVVCLFVSGLSAQEKKQKQQNDSIKVEKSKATILRNLEAKIEEIQNSEKALLRNKIEKINNRLDKKEISAEEAEILKKNAAEKAALNIQSRTAIINNRIDYVKRNGYDLYSRSDTNEISIGKQGINIKIGKNKNKNDNKVKYDIRTSNRAVFAIGFNNAIGDGQSLDDSPYKLAGSGFVELGWAWQTRLFKNSNFVRFNYGLSLQWNKLNIKDNKVFVENGDQTTLQDFPFDIKKAKFRNTNLVVPIHFEFGPTRKKDYGNRVRYFTDNNFRLGLGGFGGVRLRSQQKIVYEDADGDRVKSKEKRNFNASNFVYGVSGYIGWGDLSLYAKYDLTPIFKDQAFDQNNISLGLRWDLD